MKRKIPVLLSVLMVCLTFVFVVNFTGVSAIEDDSETSTTTTTTTTKKVEATTKTTSSIDLSSYLSSIGDNLTGTKTTVTTTTTTAVNSETHSEDGSETEKPGTTAHTTTKKTTTTKRVTTTVKRMTVTVYGNTTVAGTTMDPLSAYYSRLSETDANGGVVTTAADTTKTGAAEREANPAVTVIIVVAAMLIAISVLTGLFSLRNKKLAEKDAARGTEADDADSYDVIISQKPSRSTAFTPTAVEEDEEPIKPTQPEFTQTAVDDEDDLTADEPQTVEPDARKVPEDAGTSDPKTEGGGKDSADADKKDSYEDIFSGRDDL